MQGRGNIVTNPGLRGELKSALAAKDVIYDVSTTTRRRLLVDLFNRNAQNKRADLTARSDQADRHEDVGDLLDGMLVHIGSDPYALPFKFFKDPGPRGTRAQAALKRLDQITDELAPPTDEAETMKEANARRRGLWKKIADRNAGVATTLAPLESLDAGSTASLLHHAWVLTRVGGWVLHDWRGASEHDLGDWRLSRFVEMVDETRSAPKI